MFEQFLKAGSSAPSKFSAEAVIADLAPAFLLEQLQATKLARAYEKAVVTLASSFYVGFTGGQWEFIRTSNDAVYPRLKTDKPVHLSVPHEFVDCRLSADAAGVILGQYVLRYLMEKVDADVLQEKYFALRDFGRQQAELHLLH